jgi:anti-anti-sigma factor
VSENAQAMDSQAHVDLSRNGNVPLVRLCGEIDAGNIGQVADTIVGVIAGDRRHAGMVLDLSEVTYLNSATVKLLFDLAERMRTRQQQLRLVMTDNAPMRKLLLLLKFDLVVPLHTTIEDALVQFPTNGNTGRDA